MASSGDRRAVSRTVQGIFGGGYLSVIFTVAGIIDGGDACGTWNADDLF